MANKPPITVKINQCLFGYEDGHRLLGSSLSLPIDTESTLLRLSDLAPGGGESSNGYWTGAPLPSINSYALLYTWHAPEMTRPGCVWTQALIIKFADIARFTDLSVLRSFFVKPSKDWKNSDYSQPIEFQVNQNEDSEIVFTGENDIKSLMKLMKAVYGEKRSFMCASSNEFDSSIFKLWSQQWPALRRSFSFRTTGIPLEKATAGIRFDFRFIPPSHTDNEPPPTEPGPWEILATKDAMCSKPTAFRRFLWRYGSDIQKGVERFGFLVDLYISIYKLHPESKDYESLMLHIAKTLPDPSDGRALKSDLIEGEGNKYSLIPEINTLDKIEFFIRNPNVGGLPPITVASLPLFSHVWEHNSEDILRIAEEAISNDSIHQQEIVTQTAELVGADYLFSGTFKRRTLRQALIKEKPSLLDNDKLGNICTSDLQTLVALIPDNSVLAAKIITRLILLEDETLANDMYDRFPNVVVDTLVKTIEQTSDKNANSIPNCWTKIITSSAYNFLCSGYIDKSRSMNALDIYAGLLGYNNTTVKNFGPLPWARALSVAKEDIDGNHQDRFYSFVFSLALQKPVKGCEPIFERTFDHIHTAIAKHCFSRDALKILTPNLPYLYWWENWDTCLRLRTAVVSSYVDNGLNISSFRELTTDKELIINIQDLAYKTRKGRFYLRK